MTRKLKPKLTHKTPKAQIKRKMQELILLGKKGHEIATIFNAAGVTTTTGKPWDLSTISYFRTHNGMAAFKAPNRKPRIEPIPDLTPKPSPLESVQAPAPEVSLAHNGPLVDCKLEIKKFIFLNQIFTALLLALSTLIILEKLK